MRGRAGGETSCCREGIVVVMRIAGVECLLRNSIRNPVMLPVMAVLLVLALSAATPPDSAKADAIADAFPLPQEEGGRGEGEGGSAGGRGAGRGTSKDPFRILPEGPAEDGDNECAHLAGRMLLCMASYQSWQRSMREEAGGTGNATLPHSQSQEQDDCKEAVTEHWNCVSSQAKSSYLGGYTRIRKVRHGYMCFSPFDIYFAVALELYGEWGEEEATVMTSLISPGDTVVEVGGHMGTLTLPLAKRVGPTGTYVVFEPQVRYSLDPSRPLAHVRELRDHYPDARAPPSEAAQPVQRRQHCPQRAVAGAPSAGCRRRAKRGQGYDGVVQARPDEELGGRGPERREGEVFGPHRGAVSSPFKQPIVKFTEEESAFRDHCFSTPEMVQCHTKVTAGSQAMPD